MDFDQNDSRETVKAIEDRSPGEAVVQLVANVAGEDPLDLPPLYDTIGPESLDTLFQDRHSGILTFEYCGFTVTVEDDAIVSVKE